MLTTAYVCHRLLMARCKWIITKKGGTARTRRIRQRYFQTVTVKVLHQSHRCIINNSFCIQCERSQRVFFLLLLLFLVSVISFDECKSIAVYFLCCSLDFLSSMFFSIIKHHLRQLIWIMKQAEFLFGAWTTMIHILGFHFVRSLPHGFKLDLVSFKIIALR